MDPFLQIEVFEENFSGTLHSDERIKCSMQLNFGLIAANESVISYYL